MSARKRQARSEFRSSVFARDGHKCFFCDETKDLDAHHITDRHEMPNGGYVKENGISVCPSHHLLCEEWHSKGSGDTKYSPYSLYKLIGSSKEKAVSAST